MKKIYEIERFENSLSGSWTQGLYKTIEEAKKDFDDIYDSIVKIEPFYDRKDESLSINVLTYDNNLEAVWENDTVILVDEDGFDGYEFEEIDSVLEKALDEDFKDGDKKNE